MIFFVLTVLSFFRLTVLSLPFSAGQYSGSAGHSALAPSLLSPPCLNRYAFNCIHKGSLLSPTSKQSISLCFFLSSFQISIILKIPRKVSLKEEWTVSPVTFALSQPQTDAPGLNLFKIVLSLIGKQFNHVLNVFLVLNQSTMNSRCSTASCSQEHLSLHRDSTRCFPYRWLSKAHIPWLFTSF